MIASTSSLKEKSRDVDVFKVMIQAKKCDISRSFDDLKGWQSQPRRSPVIIDGRPSKTRPEDAAHALPTFLWFWL